MPQMAMATRQLYDPGVILFRDSKGCNKLLLFSWSRRRLAESIKSHFKTRSGRLKNLPVGEIRD